MLHNFHSPDPRYFQIAVLTALIGAGTFLLHIGVTPVHAAAALLSTQATQLLASRVLGIRFDPLSALITGLSLTLLLRTDSTSLVIVAGLLAIASKFLVRIRGKHLFNPANFAIVSLMLATDRAWISTGQWGSATIGALTIACLGFLVLSRARRAGTTLAFLCTFAGLLLARALWLGDPLTLVVHHLQNGALMVFAFFMISDPKSTPDSAAGRAVFGATVALLAVVIQFAWYQPFGPMLALFFLAPLTPLLDALWHGQRYRWCPGPDFPSSRKGASQCVSP